MDLALGGPRALVTGGAKGTGRRCADVFAAEAAHVAVCARNADEAAATVPGLRSHGVTAFGRALDVADEEACWEAEFQTDMTHSVRLLKAALPWLERSDTSPSP